MKTNRIALFAAAVLLQLSAGAAINATSAPKLTLAFDTKTNNSDGSVDVTFKLLNTSTTTGGNAPVINTVTLLVNNSLSSGGWASYAVAGQILVGNFASTNFHFFPGTYYPLSTPGTTVWTFEAHGFADDHIFGNTALGPGQLVVSNDLVVNDRTQPPQQGILGACTYEGTLSFTPLNFGYKGGTASLVIDTEVIARNASPAGCPWITGIVQNYPTGNISPSSGYGPAIGASAPTITVFPNVQLNTSTTARTMNVTMGGAFGNSYSGSFPVTQDGLTCAWTVTGFNPAQAGYTTSNPGVLQVNTGPDCLWSVTATQGQIVILNPSSTYTGSTTLTYIVPTNNTCNSRNFSVSLGNITATGSQPGLSCITAVVGTNMPGPSFLVDGSSYTGQQTFQWATGSRHTLSVISPQSAASPGTQYRLISWSQGGAAAQTVAPTKNVQYMANFATFYQLTTAASPIVDGTVAPVSGGFYKAGTTVTVSATPATGFNFLNWAGPVGNTVNLQTNVLMNAPASVTANFTSQPVVTITLRSLPTGRAVIADGQAYATPHSINVVSGTPHQLSVASPQAGTTGTRYTFLSWSQGGAQTQTVTPTANAGYTAKFNTEFQLSTAVWGPGAGTVAPAGTAYYTAGTTVAVTATPAPGYVFVGWYDEPLLPPTQSTSFLMTQPRSEFAVFAQPVTSFPLRVNTGPSYTDPAGNTWLAGDGTWFFGGAPAYGFNFGAGGTNTPDLYLTEETSSGPIELRAPVQNGSYQVKLKFADDGYTDAAAFNVSVNGQPALTNFDRYYVVGQAQGSANTAFDEVVPAQVTNGMLTVRWDPLPGHQAAINSIEVTPMPVRINAGGPAYTAPDGTQWSADTSTVGSILTTTNNINGTTTPALYQTQRSNAGGPVQYTFPLGNGTYVVRLKFAELQAKAAGQRVFNVYLNGLIAEHNFDPFAAAGAAFTAIDKVEAITVTNEALDIRLDPVTGNPAIAAIEILPSTDIRITAGGSGTRDYSYFSSVSDPPVLWDGDHNYSGGQSFSSTLPSGQFLYQSVRYNAGPLDYNFLVPNGQYFVLLKFAEIQNPSAGNTFNVAINGTAVLSNFNALLTAGAAYTPIDKWFKTAVQNGMLNIHFDGAPEIAAIEIHSLLSDGSYEPHALATSDPPVVFP